MAFTRNEYKQEKYREERERQGESLRAARQGGAGVGVAVGDAGHGGAAGGDAGGDTGVGGGPAPPSEAAGRLPQEVLDRYVMELCRAMHLGGEGHALMPTQKNTLLEILSDEDSLLRMWCDGRFAAWEKDVLEGEPPPVLTAGVLANPGFTLGADWELPFDAHIDVSRELPGRFYDVFEANLERQGLEVHDGRFWGRDEWPEEDAPLIDDEYPRVEPGGTGLVFRYDDGNNCEYGFAVAGDDPDGWTYINRVFTAFNDINQGKGAEDVPVGVAVAGKGSLVKLLAPNRAGDSYVSGWHIHIGLPNYSEWAGERIKEHAALAELPIYRLGQDKKRGWRRSDHVKPPSVAALVDERDDSGMVYRNNDIETVEFRPNDTYVETRDPGATLRRFQAQAAFYSGLAETVANAPMDYADVRILEEGSGEGLPVGYALRGPERKLTEKVTFLAALDLFNRYKATTASGEEYDVRRLIYHEWATSRPVSRKSRKSRRSA